VEKTRVNKLKDKGFHSGSPYLLVLKVWLIKKPPKYRIAAPVALTAFKDEMFAAL